MPDRKRVAIIGGGISGLGSAYHLTKFITGNQPCAVTVFEASAQLGGNAHTVTVDLGELRRADKTGEDLVRWADLGVNDFNRTAYRRLAALMDEIGLQRGRDYKPLENTESYFTLDGSLVYTDDGDLHHGTSDSSKRIPDDIEQHFKKFMDAAKKAIDGPDKTGYWETLAQYVEEYGQRLPDRKRFDHMVECILYPRVAAMYFTDERGPGQMPLRAVMEYYILQESQGTSEKPDRNYFVGGSTRWIEKLAQWLLDDPDRDVSIKIDWLCNVTPTPTGVRVNRLDARGEVLESEDFDAAVLSCHADDALRAIHPTDDLRVDFRIAEILGKVSYTNSIAVAHTYAGVMPPDRSTWRTYNVAIRRDVGITNYSMTYVENRHQNDIDNQDRPEYQRFGMPQMFVTLNPIVPIPEQFVLQAPAPKRLKLGPYVGAKQVDDRSAMAWFKHNVLNFNCLEAQDRLDEIQGMHNLYFCGGWTLGAGLHEQCLEMAERVTRSIYSADDDDGC